MNIPRNFRGNNLYLERDRLARRARCLFFFFSLPPPPTGVNQFSRFFQPSLFFLLLLFLSIFLSFLFPIPDSDRSLTGTCVISGEKISRAKAGAVNPGNGYGGRECVAIRDTVEFRRTSDKIALFPPIFPRFTTSPLWKLR